MMERISIKAELSERYTHHCICASTVTSLFQFQHGVYVRKICAITKHKDEQSLTHYINETTSAQKRECSKIFRDTFQPQLAVQQEASGITRQNVAGPSAGPTSNSNPVSSPKPIYFLGAVEPKLHPTYLDFNNDHLSWKVWRTAAIHPKTPPNNRERW